MRNDNGRKVKNDGGWELGTTSFWELGVNCDFADFVDLGSNYLLGCEMLCPIDHVHYLFPTNDVLLSFNY